jgi:hypothetical protein
MADRISLSKEWYDRGAELLDEFEKYQNPRLLFEAYIYLWISLTVAAKQYCASDGKLFSNTNGQKSVDKDEILYWASKRKYKLMSMFNKNEDLFIELCERNGSKTNKPIMDVENDDVIHHHREFIRYWNNESKYTTENNIIKTFILILNRVRNNLFHGGKSFTVESDIELLKLTCPLLKETSKICIESN